ncbi:hypothetical protein [Cohnella lupini]|uniref:Uncharacterized protein n=1 Tax=Cohnella lupini TaxID=1294267 RepID=A0A3D9I0D5_9BACL|nr:hypothetical protein [Cohnella lupini]RED55101.1 hypothetical protein DFP95_11936 [Cohnella lupini]
MEKQKYYVSVQSRTIMSQQGDAAYEFEDGYDYYLREIYKTIQQLGTEETRDHISTMKL